MRHLLGPWRTRQERGREVEEELEFHLTCVTEELMRSGLSRKEARDRAITTFGDLPLTRRECVRLDTATDRRVRWVSHLRDTLTDIHIVTRSLLRQRLTTALTVGTLALGVASTTALWSVTRHLLLHPVPFRDADRVVIAWQTNTTSRMKLFPRLTQAERWRAAPSFEAIEVARTATAILRIDATAEIITTRAVSDRFLPFTGTTTILGRNFLPEELVAGGQHVALLGYGFWQRRFGGDRAVIGRTVRIDNAIYQVVGVTPEALDRTVGPLRAAAIWLPLVVAPTSEEQGVVFGRLRPGATAATAESELKRLDARPDPSRTTPPGQWAPQVEAAAVLMGQRTARTLYSLMGAVLLLMVIAAMNVTHFLLGRAVTARREMAVRAALGATRGRLARHGLAEAMVIGIGGGLVGLLLSTPFLTTIIRLSPASIPGLNEVRHDSSAGMVAMLFGVGSALAAALVPIWRGGATKPWSLLSGARASQGKDSHRLRSLLVVVETALSLTLLVGTALLTRSLWRAEHQDTGIRADEVVALELRLPEWRYQTNSARMVLMNEITARLRAISGVVGVAQSSGVPPMSGVEFGTLEVEGRMIAPGTAASFFASTSVTADYFAVAGLSVVAGHGFDPALSPAAPSAEQAIIINQSFAAQYWPGVDPVGKRLRIGGDAWLRVIGVVVDVPALGLANHEGSFQLYRQLSPEDIGQIIVIRSHLPMNHLAPLVRSAVAERDPDVPIVTMATVRQLLNDSVGTERFTLVLLAAFAVTAVILSAAGLFGVLTHTIAQQTRAIGVRIALGADATAVQWMVMRNGMMPVAVGVAIGLGLSLIAGRVLSTLLYDISPRDSIALVGAALLSLSVAVVASYLAATRALAITPMEALRSE